MEGGVFTLPGCSDVLIPMLPEFETTVPTSDHEHCSAGGESSDGSDTESDDTSGVGANMGHIWGTWTLVGLSFA